ncbi:DUF6010 family protein [Foetidibacter luteolus]|uniref:DUF6010 family protein n=1 Tax=Foetidibacter luteolus TaxID=2608880 RepID=UPI00129BBBF0|nr:DUF6010 family protein [Foetidibacter luteolus]
MIPVIIGISSGLLIIFVFILLKQFDKPLIYGLVLCGIGFLYVGFDWSNTRALVINSAQAVLFVFIAYYGIKKSKNILASGYFLHGIWDLLYHKFQDSGLIPPQYDLFCLSIDFTMGFYILAIKKAVNKAK